MLTRSTSRDDTGSALVMAIIFVTVVGLAVTMGLGYSAVSLRASTRHYEPARDRVMSVGDRDSPCVCGGVRCLVR